MKKLLLIIFSLLVLGIAAVWVIHFTAFYGEKRLGQPSISVQSPPLDLFCTGRSQYGEYGVEHTYKGDIKSGISVNIILSCDHKRFTITGAVQQVIATNEELADLSSGSEVVGVESDYDFDGFNDLSAIVSNGQGMEQIDEMHIYLYDPRQNKFVFNRELSGLENVWSDEEKQEIIQTFVVLEGEKAIKYNTARKWRDGKLVKIREEKCESAGSGASDICAVTRNY